MNLESFAQKEVLPKVSKFEFFLNSEQGFKDLEKLLTPLLGEEGAEQCAFVLRSMAEKDFTNHCEKATQEFGRELNRRFGEEESFFELVPPVNFSDVRNSSPLEKIGYRGGYHSVGLLEFNPENKQAFSLALDLTYGDVAVEKRSGLALALYCPGTGKQALEMLKNHYGGSWRKELMLNKKTGQFVFYEKKDN